MHYLVEIQAKDGRRDLQLIEEKTIAEYRYFRALAAVSQKSPVRAEDGGLAHLIGCFLYEVSAKEKSIAREMVRKNEARRMQSSNDPMCGEPIEIEGLFKAVH
jgi:hypothetical protein